MIYGAKAFISRARVDSCCEIDKFVSNVTSLFYYYVDGCIDAWTIVEKIVKSIAGVNGPTS